MLTAKNIIQKLKSRYKVNNGWQLLLILVTFSIAGLTLLQLKDYVMVFTNPGWGLKIIQFLFINMPLYYLFLLTYGILLGQGYFFRPFVLKSLTRITVPFKLLYQKIK